MCRKVDKNIPEDQKISHLMKGVAEDLYQVLINREVSTVDKFVACCCEVDAMRKKRVVPLRYERLSNVTHCNIVRVQYFVRGGFVRHRSRASLKHLSPHFSGRRTRFLGGQTGVVLHLQAARVGVGSTKKPTRC
ncbi:uncharacterized protein TNCV_3093511 [Trichonephila clavipes]|nr:uncharacterized protein TNCV_3093511 [Trichonephila clavipes]